MKTKVEVISKKEVSTMIRKCLAITLVVLIGTFNVVPAHAYTSLSTPVAVTASGTLSGTITNLSVSVVTQGTGATAPKVDFGTTSAGVQNSGEALKISGGAGQVDSRIIVYTDNASYYTTGNDPAIDATTGKPTGIDGAGMPGALSAPQVVPLIWGLTSNVDFAPNSNPAYTFTGSLQAGTANSVYVTDLRHTYDFVTQDLVDKINARLGTTYTIAQIDTMTLYKTDGTAVANTASEGVGDVPQLVPTFFGAVGADGNLWDSATPATRKLIREGLYKNIATIAYGIRTPDPSKSDETGYFMCQCPNLSTPANSSDNVRARLAKYGTGTTDAYLYVPVGGDFTGKPWQDYQTTKLTVGMVSN